jgi:pimeloyl-ACP methyl ester carboxylesterase
VDRFVGAGAATARQRHETVTLHHRLHWNPYAPVVPYRSGSVRTWTLSYLARSLVGRNGGEELRRALVLTTTARARTELREVGYSGGSVEISLTLRPGGDDLLLCLHGLGCAKESFASAYAVPELAGLTIGAFDFPGHGASGRLADPADYAIPAYADLTGALVRQLNPRRLFLLCHSMGCAVGLVASQELRTNAFISVEGNLVSQDCGLVSRRIAAQSREEYVGTEHPRFQAGLAASSRSDLRSWEVWYAQADPVALHRCAESLVEWSDSGKLLDLFTAQPRATYIHGGDSDLDYLLPSLRGTAVHAIPGSGHFPMVDNPAAFWRAVVASLPSH